MPVQIERKPIMSTNKYLPPSNCRTDAGDYIGCDLPPDPELAKAGWERRFIADPKRADEAVETYSELGFEVKLSPVDVDALSEACGGCKTLFKNFRVVYTRKKM